MWFTMKPSKTSATATFHNTSDSSESNQDQDSSPEHSEDEEEDFQTVPIDDEHWTTEMV